VLRSFVEAGWPNGPTWQTREAETEAACRTLGCDYQQWDIPDNAPDWDDARDRLYALPDVGRVWAPLPENDGHLHHNGLAAVALQVFPHAELYATYTYKNGKSTVGALVEPEPGWEQTKREAMASYVSQATHPATHLPFDTWPIDEYLTVP
jgi:LmbE family N-acetylglucosaminyl deacetylase